jgi:hypothetical protein
MSELLESFDAIPDVIEQDTDVSPDTLVLITEQQVRFATAARRIEVPDTEAEPRRRHRPRRNDFLEDSRMAREMFRL